MPFRSNSQLPHSLCHGDTKELVLREKLKHSDMRFKKMSGIEQPLDMRAFDYSKHIY
jgi:hypothetical protein